MESETNFFEPLIERAQNYGKTSYELMKLRAVDKTADITSTFVSRAIAIGAIILSVIFLSIGASFWFGELLGKLYYGFFLVAAFYAFVGCILYFVMHKWMKKRAGNAIVSKMLN